MNCEDCLNVIRRVKVGHGVELVCCLDGIITMGVIQCSRFFMKDFEIEAPSTPVIKQGEVIDLGYGAVEKIGEKVKKRGRPKKNG